MECMWLRLRMIPVRHWNKSPDCFLETRWSLARHVELKDPSNGSFWWWALPNLRHGELLLESKHAAWFSLMDLLFPLKCGTGVHQSDAPVQHCLRWNESRVALLLHSPVRPWVSPYMCSCPRQISWWFTLTNLTGGHIPYYTHSCSFLRVAAPFGPMISPKVSGECSVEMWCTVMVLLMNFVPFGWTSISDLWVVLDFQDKFVVLLCWVRDQFCLSH